MSNNINLLIIALLFIGLVYCIWNCECPLIEENRNRMYGGLYRRGIYPYSTLTPYRQAWYHRLYAPWYDPLYMYDDPVNTYGYCRMFPGCYPCPGWRNMGPPMCP